MLSGQLATPGRLINVWTQGSVGADADLPQQFEASRGGGSEDQIESIRQLT
jgi:hypothetical protein